MFLSNHHQRYTYTQKEKYWTETKSLVFKTELCYKKELPCPCPSDMPVYYYLELLNEGLYEVLS